MKYRVTGANRTTGEDFAMMIEAGSRDEARVFGNRSMIVANVELATATASPSSAKAELTPSPTTARVPVPEYQGIITGAKVLRWFSVVCYAVALAWLAMAIIQVLQNVTDGKVVPIGRVIESLQSGFEYFLGGAIVGLLSSLSLAMRDLTRNSFRAQSRL